MGGKCLEFHCDTTRTPGATKCRHYFQHHVISGLCATDENWPLQLWDQLTHQATITLNLLRTPRIDPTKSAHETIHGAKYDWDKHPMTPPGTRAIVYEAPDSRASWGPPWHRCMVLWPRIGPLSKFQVLCARNALISYFWLI